MEILLIDDHPLFRSGIATVVEELDETATCTHVSNCEDALRLIIAGGQFELILLDLNLPGMDGMTGITILRDASPATPIVIVTATENSSKIKQALSAGAKGYIPKSSSRNIMLSALRLVLSGGVYLPVNFLQLTKINGKANTDVSDKSLTLRQQEVLRLVARGKSNKEIGYELGMAENTVRVHVAAILKYLDVKNRTEAGYAATNRGMGDILD